MHFFRGKIDFILRHTRRPQQSHHFRVGLGTQARQNRGGILSQVPGRAGRFPFLIQRARIYLDFRSYATFVIVERF